MSRKKADWVLPGGKPGELGYCTRCGQGLTINPPQPIPIALACMEAFVKMHSECWPGKYIEKPPMTPGEWAAGRDTGTSSFTIFAAITGQPSPHGRFDVPHDPQDFGRCYRLLKLFPQWRHGLFQTVAKCAAWKPFVDVWDELTSMYEAALRSHEAGNKDAGVELYDRIKQLEGRAA